MPRSLASAYNILPRTRLCSKLKRNVCKQVFDSVFPNYIVVFDSNPALQCSGVNAGFEREHIADFEYVITTRNQARCFVPPISDTMPRVVPESRTRDFIAVQAFLYLCVNVTRIHAGSDRFLGQTKRTADNF